MIAAGDLAQCGRYWPREVAKVIAKIPGTFAMLGDGAYDSATLQEYIDCYGAVFGQFNNRVKPNPGNHEYIQTQANGYFQYFGTKAGSFGNSWYSYDLGNWHIVAIDSECAKVGGCGVGSAQYEWVKADLQRSTTACLAFAWHRPRWTSSTAATPETSMSALYQLGIAEGADFILSGHAHNYERFARLAADGTPSPTGIRQFVVGTGGAARYASGPAQSATTSPTARCRSRFDQTATTGPSSQSLARRLPTPDLTPADHRCRAARESGV